MNKREKRLFFVVLILLAVIMFMSNSFRKKNYTIDFNNNLINRYKNDIKSYNIKIDSLNAVLLAKKNIDTVIITKYKQKIDSVYVYNYNDYVVFYDTLLNTNLANVDTFICFDSISIQKLAIKLIECNKDSELLANCYLQNNIYDNIIAVQDSVIILKDSVINSNDKIYSSKIKKLRKQRNTFAGATFVEFLVILGLISK